VAAGSRQRYLSIALQGDLCIVSFERHFVFGSYMLMCCNAATRELPMENGKASNAKHKEEPVERCNSTAQFNKTLFKTQSSVCIGVYVCAIAYDPGAEAIELRKVNFSVEDEVGLLLRSIIRATRKPIPISITYRQLKATLLTKIKKNR
jgi:hypothetical protein